MSFREKTAWVTLSAILIVFFMYFLHVPRMFETTPGEWELMMVALSFAAFILIEVVAYVVLYLRFPKDARTPKDERERLIELKATRLAAYVYVAGTFLAILTPHHGANGFAVGIFVLFAFGLAEIVNYTARIVYYRRGV
jgi:predicted ferric reductase